MLRNLVLVLMLGCIAYAKLSVKQVGDNFAIYNDGQLIVERLESNMDSVARPECVKRSFATLPDGTKVWNKWCEDKEARYRLEVAERADGAIELTLMGESGCGDYEHARKLDLRVPADAFMGANYDALEGNGRSFNDRHGVIGKELSGVYRWLNANGVVFDFNPIGCTDYCLMYSLGTVRGQCRISYENGGFLFGCGSPGGKIGSHTGTKIVICNGDFNSYFKMHAMKSYKYSQHLLPSHLFCFGAPVFGNNYANGNKPFDAKAGFGWVEGAPENVNVGYKEGAYYSNVSGHGKAVFRISGLPFSGYYVFTVGIGNYIGDDSKFSIRLNGKEEFGQVPAIGKRKAFIVSRTVHVSNGQAEFQFEGDYMLSAIGVQPLMADMEDFQMQRGFWVSDGYEPGSIFRNEDYKHPVKLTLAPHMIDMPVPGTEMPDKPLEIPQPVDLGDTKGESCKWLEDFTPYRLLSNSATMAELDDSADRKKFLDEELKDKGFNVAMLSGMHSRHTYMNHIQRGIEAVRMLADEMHSRGLKLIDHHDATLLWNSDSGLRCLAERLPEMEYGVLDNLPSFQFCITNPTFNDTYYGYLRELVKAGVDGLQLDEIKYWNASCSCAYCREKFTRETGCTLPLNECDKRLYNTVAPLWKMWHSWHTASVTNWKVELRRRTRDLKPDLVLSTYTTHWGMIYSLPRHNASVDLLDLGRVVNVSGTEVMTRNTIQSSRSLMPYRKMSNMFPNTFGTSVWGWYYDSNWKTNYFSCCVSNMMNQSCLLAVLDKPKDAPKFAEFFATDVAMKKKGAVSIAEIGLFFSKCSRDWNSLVGFDGEIFGLAQELECLHIPYDFIWEMNLNDKFLDKYKIIALGATGCMSDETIAALRRYVERGGVIYMTTITGAYDQYGTLRKKWAFQDIFGFQLAMTGRREQFGALSRNGEEVTLARKMDSFLRKGQGDILYEERQYGKGRFIYCSLPIASRFFAMEISHNQRWKFELDEKLEVFYQKFISGIFADARCWDVSGAGQKIYTTLWKEASGSTVIHFINASGANLKLGEICTGDAPKDAFPKIPNDISFVLYGSDAKKATAYSPDYRGQARPLKLEKVANGVKVLLPKECLDVYAMIRLEK